MNLGAAELVILFMIVVLPLLLGLGIALLLNSRRRGRGDPSISYGAMATLQERYARGEISQAEFEQHRAVLSGQAPPADGFS